MFSKFILTSQIFLHQENCSAKFIAIWTNFVIFTVLKLAPWFLYFILPVS